MNPGSVMRTLSVTYKPAADSVGKIKLLADRNVEGAVFDLPEKVAKDLLAAVKAAGETGDVYDVPKAVRCHLHLGGDIFRATA